MPYTLLYGNKESSSLREDLDNIPERLRKAVSHSIISRRNKVHPIESDPGYQIPPPPRIQLYRIPMVSDYHGDTVGRSACGHRSQGLHLGDPSCSNTG